ncbi:endo alpha-1,4 polygalactosaminidase [Brevibacterium sp. 'Marine']|uniref:endo alpha-1,4 polygalactosaminidase n=1 Tax=Brevibacterium sp. 'Marine' TaxID=2725563 RepID=UPI002006ECF2|nr:endo alpha-1,4 polygalactosaminidase [Brevibacterium sp. 'Marine']
MRPPPIPIPPRWMAAAVAIGLGIAGAMGGCSANASPPSTQASGAPSLPTSGTFDYQLGGTYDSLPDQQGRIDIVVRDAGAAPLTGAYSVCYVNGFQTQPDEAADWRDYTDLLLHDAAGDLIVDPDWPDEHILDPDWPDEHILDPSTADRRSQILDIIGPVIDSCAQSGFDAVEIDNLDTADRFPDIDRTGALELAAAYVDRAHTKGLSIAQKNAAELADAAHTQLGFDFAVAEECAAFDECAAYTETYGDRVLAIEYPDTLAEAGLDFADACTVPDRPPLMILRDRDLVAAGDHGYRYDTC